MKRFGRALGRAALWPFSRFFDPRFQGLARQAEAQHEDLARRIEEVHARVAARLEETATLDETTALVQAARTQILQSVTDVKEIATAEMEAATEASELIGRSLADLLGEVERLVRQLEEIQQRLDKTYRETKTRAE